MKAEVIKTKTIDRTILDMIKPYLNGVINENKATENDSNE